MTAMAEALRAAGVTPAKEELDNIIREVCSRKFHTHWHMCAAVWAEIGHRKDFIDIVIASREKDLVSRYLEKMIPPPEFIPTEAAKKEQQAAFQKERRWLDDWNRSQNETAIIRKVRAEEKIVEIKEGAVHEYKRSILFTFTINGKPIGDVFPKEAFGWADSNQQKVDFVTMMLSGVSLHDERPIKEIILPSEANKQWIATGGRLPYGED